MMLHASKTDRAPGTPRILRTHLHTYYGRGHGVSNEAMMFGGGLFSSLGWDEVYLPFELATDEKRFIQICDSGPYDAVFTMPFTGIDSWIRELVGPDCKIIAWIPDDAWRFAHTRTLIEAGVYDWYVTTAEEALPSYAAAGQKNVILSNFACRPDKHWHLPHPRPEISAQASFCGIFYGDREQRLQAIANAGRIAIDVHDCGREVLPPEEYFAMMARSAFTLALTNSSAGPKQMKARLFEPQYFGSLLVTEPVPGLEKWWTPGEECIVFGSPNEAQEQMESLLADPDRYAAMTERAFVRAVTEHSYHARFRDIFAAAGLPCPSFPEFNVALDPAAKGEM